MVFTPPSYAPPLPYDPPNDVSLPDFIYDPKYRVQKTDKQHIFTCGLTGKAIKASEARERVEALARALSKRSGWLPQQEETEWEKIACIYSINAIDYSSVAHAVQRLNGIVTPASASYNQQELEYQLKTTNATVLFTCAPLLETALKAAEAVKLPRHRIFIVDTPANGYKPVDGFVSVAQLIAEGAELPLLPKLQWIPGQGERQVAFICFSSGTSGLPKGVMISHHNIISNIVQVAMLENTSRDANGGPNMSVLGLLPLSHIYGLTIICHLAMWRGDEVIVLPKYDLDQMLSVIDKYSINMLYLVPPIIVQLLSSPLIRDKYSLKSVHGIYSGAAPLGVETIEEVNKIFPTWKVRQGYGLTESSPGIVSTQDHDLLPGSAGSIIPGEKCKIIDAAGNEVTTYDTPGELYAQGPNIVLGYLNNPKATAETFVHHADGRWLRTGDEVVIRLSPKGHEHLVIVDRIKELIKVKGHQVAPAELEAHLLSHELVADCAVIQVPDARAGEVPKAFVVKSAAAKSVPDEEAAKTLYQYVADHKARYKRLEGGIEFIEIVPKSPSGKILRRLLRDREKEARAKKNAARL
ncbi:unnamed protein product [Discula destructiva]